MPVTQQGTINTMFRFVRRRRVKPHSEQRLVTADEAQAAIKARLDVPNITRLQRNVLRKLAAQCGPVIESVKRTGEPLDR